MTRVPIVTGISRTRVDENIEEGDNGDGKTPTGTRSSWTFVLGFLISCFAMKIVGEAVHELLGHGFFVLLFGGRIRYFHISILWPYESSYIGWSVPGATADQMILVIAGGMLACSIISFSIQILLFKMHMDWQFAIPLFWLSFRCYANTTGYLIVGGIFPYGDVEELIRRGVVTSFTATIIGVILFLIGFFFLSEILRRILMISLKAKTGYAMLAFWLIIPALVVLYMADRGMFDVFLVPFSFIPILLSYLLEFRIRGKQDLRWFDDGCR